MVRKIVEDSKGKAWPGSLSSLEACYQDTREIDIGRVFAEAEFEQVTLDTSTAYR